MRIGKQALVLSAFAALCGVLTMIGPIQAAQVRLTWQDPNNNPTEVGGYTVYYWQTNWDTPASVDVGDQTAYTLPGLTPGQTYHFAVTAHDGNGGRESAFSNEITHFVPAPSDSIPPAPPTGLTVTSMQ
jgi:hypothetical protein